jgi:two-component system, NtrC family, response regulator HydG
LAPWHAVLVVAGWPCLALSQACGVSGLSTSLPNLAIDPLSMNKDIKELAAFLETQPEPRIVLDVEFNILAANEAYAREFRDGRPVRGGRCFEVSHGFSVPCDQAGESCPLNASRRSGVAQRVLHVHHTPRGPEHVDVETTPLLDATGSARYFVETLRTVRHASSQAASHGLVGQSAAFKQMLEKVMRVAGADASVLLLGETGTGKELVARAIHEASPRAKGPFITVDCAGLTETLFESELFGYEKGAFTGAAHRKPGLVEAAAGGTLFLDEIGELPPSQQVKLLRLLESGSYRRVGGLETLYANFRLVSATHRNLAAMVHKETYRRDLYFRINTFPILTPALHERRQDIPLLAISLLARVDRQRGRNFTAAALDWLRARHYAGNIRELRNVIERGTLMCDGPEVDRSDLEQAVDPYPVDPDPVASASPVSAFTVDSIVDLATLERRYTQWVYARCDTDMASLADRLGVSVRTAYRKLGQATE